MRSSPPCRFSRPDRFALLLHFDPSELTDWIFIDSLCDVTFSWPDQRPSVHDGEADRDVFSAALGLPAGTGRQVLVVPPEQRAHEVSLNSTKVSHRVIGTRGARLGVVLISLADFLTFSFDL